MTACHLGVQPLQVPALQPSVAYESALVRSIVRSTPRVKGSWLLGTGAVRILPPESRHAELTLVGGQAFRVGLDLAIPPQFTLVRNGQYDLVQASVIAAMLKEGDTFVDVGANWGYFTCIASQRVGSSGSVVSLEPNGRAFGDLWSTIHRNGLSNVLPLNYAAWKSPGARVSLVRRTFRQTTSTFVREGGSEIGTITLDMLVSRLKSRFVPLVKVDVEGAELQVLEGAEAILSEHRPALLLEVSPYTKRFGYEMRDLYDHLDRRGFVPTHYVADGPHEVGLLDWNPDRLEGEILFQHRDRKRAVDVRGSWEQKMHTRL